MATRGGAPKKNFFYENALSGSIHSTYQLPSLQTDQKPTLGQPSAQLCPGRSVESACHQSRSWTEGAKGRGRGNRSGAGIITSGHSAPQLAQNTVISQFIKHVLYQRETRRGAGLFWRQKSFSLWQNSGRKNNRNKHLYNIAIARYLISNSNMNSRSHHLGSPPGPCLGQTVLTCVP